MKKLLMTTALSAALVFSSVVQAAAAPTMSRDYVKQATISTQSSQIPSAGWGIIALMTVLIIIAAASGGGGGGDHYYAMMSDKRLKTDIKRVGTSPSGIPIYHYRYLGHPQMIEGVIAQDVARIQPGAVSRGEKGLLMVNYNAIDVTLRLVN